MHDDCLSDDKAPDALVVDGVPSADGHVFCKKCASDTRVQTDRHCFICRRGPFCNVGGHILGHNALAACVRCARPTCSTCVRDSAWTCHDCQEEELPLLVADDDDDQETPILVANDFAFDDFPPLVTSRAFSLDALAYRV